MRRLKALPDNWKRVKLRKLVAIDKDSLGSKTSPDYEFSYISLSDVNTGVISSELPLFRFENAPSRARRKVKKGDVLFSTVRPNLEGFGRINVSDTNLVASTGFAVLSPIERADSEFIYQYLYSCDIKKQIYALVVGSNYPAVNSPDVANLRVSIPNTVEERKAIADLLCTWDETIEKTERLVKVKEMHLAGQIQQLMSNKAIEGKEWKKVHLSHLFNEVNRKVHKKELIPFSISAGVGFVSQREKWGKDISGSQHENYTHLKAGEFAYNKGNSKRYKQGCVYLLKAGEICVPNVFISFMPKNKDVLPEFFEHYFLADYHARELKRYITSGARSDGLLNLNKRDFFKIMVPCPSIDEQKAIAETLNAAQKEIYLLKQLLEKYKSQKRGLMQKMLTGVWRMKTEIINKYMEI